MVCVLLDVTGPPRGRCRARAALSRASRAAGRRLRVLLGEVEEQRLRGERYRLQVGDVTAATSRAGGVTSPGRHRGRLPFPHSPPHTPTPHIPTCPHISTYPHVLPHGFTPHAPT